MGSQVDMPHAQKMIDLLKEDWGIESEVFVGSAHKVPVKVAKLIEKVNGEEQVVYITIAGRSNALSGVVAANSVHPVLACPPFADKDDMIVNMNSTLMMPSECPVMTVVDPKNAVLAAAKILALGDKDLKAKVAGRLERVKNSFDL